MLMPIGRNMFDEIFDSPFAGFRTHDLMNTDVKETDEGYEVTIDMPGVKKENLKAELKDGYLMVSATTDYSNDVKDDEKYIRRERYSGSFSRSFYVGENVKQEDIKAKFEDGTLKLLIPRKEIEKQVEQKKYIAIE